MSEDTSLGSFGAATAAGFGDIVEGFGTLSADDGVENGAINLYGSRTNRKRGVNTRSVRIKYLQPRIKREPS